MLLLWGGIVGLLRTVDLYERKHILVLGGYTTLVAGLVMKLIASVAAHRRRDRSVKIGISISYFVRRVSRSTLSA